MTKNELQLIHTIFDLLNDLNNDISYESEDQTIDRICRITKLTKSKVAVLLNDYISGKGI